MTWETILIRPVCGQWDLSFTILSIPVLVHHDPTKEVPSVLSFLSSLSPEISVLWRRGELTRDAFSVRGCSLWTNQNLFFSPSPKPYVHSSGISPLSMSWSERALHSYKKKRFQKGYSVLPIGEPFLVERVLPGTKRVLPKLLVSPHFYILSWRTHVQLNKKFSHLKMSNKIKMTIVSAC